MTRTVEDILGPDGAIARRLGAKYEHRPQQLELAGEVARAIEEGQHLLAEAGTGVGKSFAYLVPAIEYAVRNKKRVVVSTHTISLQEQLIQKDIPLIRSVYPDEFTAVLVKGRSNYLCKRRLEQARGRQGLLFETNDELASLWAIEQWVAEDDAAGGASEGSLSELRQVPLPQVWDKVAAEHGNCLGKKCGHYAKCYWQAAKRRMQGGNVLVVNHALFFSDLALRMAGVNYLPKYDVVVLDEAHTVEEVAGQHFGIKVSEASVKYNLRSLYDLRRGKGLLTALGPVANDAIMSVVDLHEATEEFFDRAIRWHEANGKSNGRIREPNILENTLTPKLRELSTKLRGLVTHTEKDEEITELTALSNKVGAMGQALEALVSQSMADAVYWMDIANRTPKRLTWHAAPIDVAEGLKRHLFGKMHSVVMTSATLCTGGKGGETRKPAGPSAGGSDLGGMGVPPVHNREAKQPAGELRARGYLPHLTPEAGVFAVNFRLADSIPKEVAERWRAERQAILARAEEQSRGLTGDEQELLAFYEGERVEEWLEKGEGECLLRQPEIGALVEAALKHFEGDRYQLLAWSVMPNHVHAVLRPLEGNTVAAILHSWKSYTSHEINSRLGRQGTVWMEESYDRFIRNEAELNSQVEYASKNPERAGMKEWAWCGKNEQAVEDSREFVREVDVSLRDLHGRDARDTTPQGASRDAQATKKSSAGTTSPGTSRDGQATRKSSAGMTPQGASRDVCVTPPQGGSQAAPLPGSFSYIARRLGLGGVGERVRGFEAGSPFDYGRQCTLYIERDLPDPADRLFTVRAKERVLHYLQKTNGGAFVLFTAYKPMIDMANALKASLDRLGLPLMVQGQGAPRNVLLERFKGTPNAVLFGTSSFWQGIDVQGDALRNVIIVKLPFSVPDEPLTEAKLEAITKRGGNAFMEFSVPEAIIRLKQGFGRLIRSRSDQGIVVLLDSRVVTKRYGRLFLDALPKAKVVEVTKFPELGSEEDYPQVTWEE